MATTDLTAQRLRELLHYDPDTGLLVWKVRISQRGRVGRVISCIAPTGYVVTRIYGKGYLAHRLAWLHFYGEWPSCHIDHIDGDRSNNRIDNLRIATDRENSQNRRAPQANNRYGLLGVSPHKKKWMAQISVDGKKHQLGSYGTPEEAHAAYIVAKRRLHPYGTI